MGSSRLPGKVLKPLGASNVLSYVTSRCRKIQGVSDVIVATSTLPKDDDVEKWCEENDIACFRGSEHDVLDRYVQCAKLYAPDYVMRITADCPFVDYEMASDIVELMKRARVDIIDVVGELPRGLVVELISYKALLEIDKKGKEERHREHVTYYAYEYKEEFTRIVYEVIPEIRRPELRITLDTEEDYELCQAIGNHFDNQFVSSAEIIRFLTEYPDIASLNAHIEQKPVI